MEDNVKRIEQELEQTTESLNRNLHLIESEIVKKVQDTKDAALDKIEDIKEKFNIRKQVEKHPTQMVGGALVTGIIVGAIVSGSSKKTTKRAQPSSDNEFSSDVEVKPQPRSVPHTRRGPSVVDRFFSEFRGEIDLAKKILLGVAVNKAGEVLGKKMPQWTPVIRDIVGGTSRKLGSDDSIQT